MYPEEIKKIADRHFSKLKRKPCQLPLKFPNGVKYDDLIAGWVQYWNDIFRPKDPLDPNLIKALIASESGFDPTMLTDKKNSNSARGLMQIINQTRKILGNEKGELKDHFLTVTKSNLNDPNINICAGIRWLFQKKLLASSKLKRPATWEEAVAEYKGTLEDWRTGTKKGNKIMKIFQDYFSTFTRCKKS
ncbi:MAG: transglycosylase SLT domain-containing protein [Bdellovibrio sp.]|nr:transglycosylase SLT domain-containing protein [Bdellovibrio sp.]